MTWASVFEWVVSLVQWWVTVMPWEQGIRVRWGKNVAMLTPGVHLKVPIMDRVYVQGMRLRTADLGTQTVQTKDGKPRTVSAVLAYKIKDLRILFEAVQDAEDTIVDLARASLAIEVEQNGAAATAEELGKLTTRRLRLSQYGIEGGRVSLVDMVDARTYRLISDDKPVHTSEGLDTVGYDA